MRVILCLLLAIAVFADKNDNRRNKLPFVADAVGNSLPPPSSVPATVGSPVNLLTPDRYEFYTFDESGELVKRLMTLQEIQAIVAAGEEGEGLVTFPNENKPTVAFNIHQPPYTKVHSVVTNVQNVLKAQMEAHKNKPQISPTLDTPDVSDSWSLILPSIFGNSGVDIVFDKSPSVVSTPETETILENAEDEENSLSKEGSNQVLTSSTISSEENVAVTEKIPSKDESKVSSFTASTNATTIDTTKITQKPSTTTSAPTTTIKSLTTTKTLVPSTTTKKPTTVSRTNPTISSAQTKGTTLKPRITSSTPKSTTHKPIIINTTKETTITPETVFRPHPTISAPKPIIYKPVIITSTKVTTTAPEITTKLAETILVGKNSTDIKVDIQSNSNSISTTEKTSTEYEKFSTFIPISTINYVTDRTTHKPIVTTKRPTLFASTTKRSVPTTIKITTTTTTTKKIPSTQTTKTQQLTTTNKPVISTVSQVTTLKSEETDKINVTTVTTQSVSPSTTVSSTEIISADKLSIQGEIDNKPEIQNENDKFEDEEGSIIPLFDIGQSISQIASDLGGSYQPIPTTSNLLDTTKIMEMDLESKENVDIDIPSGLSNDSENKIQNNTNSNIDNFIKISTLDPHENSKNKITDEKEVETDAGNKPNNIIIDSVQKIELTPAAVTTEATTVDPILSESMGDLLSQVVNEAPQSIIGSQNPTEDEVKISTTEKYFEPTTLESLIEPTSEISNKVKKETSTTMSTPVVAENKKEEVSSTTSTTVTTSITTKFDRLNTKSEMPDKNKIEITTKPFESDFHDSGKNDINEQNFIQISASAHNRTKVESITEKNKHNSESSTEQNVEPIKSNENETVTEDSKNTTETKMTNAETTTTKSDFNISTTTFAPQKLVQSNINKIVTGEKNGINSKKDDKQPEALPKVDDFKKKIQKVNIAEEELISERNNSWKLVPTLAPSKPNEIPKDKVKSENHYTPENSEKKVILEFSKENQGLEVTTKDLGEDITRFTELSNELAFRYWNVMVDEIDKKRSFVLSPYSIFSMLAMIFMGARGATSGEMNEILKLDDMVTFNPHFTLKNISDSIETTPESGVAVSAFIRELYSDRNKGKILTFYKERAQHFYNGHVEEINFKLISDIIRRRTNLLFKRYTWGKIPEYMKSNTIVMQAPLAALTANIFQTDCTGTSVDGRDGEMYFVVSPNVRQRRLVPVPAVVYKSGFLAGYDPVLDATVAALGNTKSIVSTLFLMPGQQGNVVHADDLEKLESRLLESIPTTPTWNRVLRTLLPRSGLELQIPRFAHKSTFNVSSTLKKMGLKDLFDGDHADLGGLNGPSKDLYLSDMIQINTFVTCGEGVIGEQHHIEEYPEAMSVAQRRRARWLNDWDEPRDYQRAFHDPHDVGDAMHLPLHLRPRQARLPSRSAQPARLKFDRPFLYFVRHNPSGMILYFGRYNPRLLP